MTDDAYFQDGDQLSEGNLGKALLADNNKDYFDRGGGITGPSGGEITVEAAQAFIEDTSSEQLYKVYPTAETLVLPVASGNNYVYATFDPATQDSATWEVTDTQGSGLTNPVSLLRAVVDTSSSSVGLRNDDPVGSFELVSTGSIVTKGIPTETIADDSVTTVSVDFVPVEFLLIFDLAGTNAYARLLTGSNGIDDTLKNYRINNSDNTVLSGTTGPDGNVNVSRDGTELYIENRLDTPIELHGHYNSIV